ncbi:pitrilysin family protein [Oscillospiraceae bacterium WX1]
MKSKGYDRIREQVFTEKLENGLTVFVVPKRGYNKKYAFFATDYGGADRRFQLAGQWIDTPMGVAHFLEHKMFDTEDGNALANLSANGASPNAFTSSDITAYFFESIDKFEENLEILLQFVSVPYFTPESVQKEQGIIGQEIRMTEDEPDYAVYYGLMKALYRHNPLRDSVAGTVESIAEITADTLYNCHAVFYNPSNMVLCVAGDVEPERILELARKILPKEAGEIPNRDYGPAESSEPENRRAEKKMSVSIPIFLIGAKAKPVKDGADYLRQELIGNLALDILAGHSSPLYLRLYQQGLVNSGFSATYEAAAGAFYTMLGGESKDPDTVFEAVKEEALAIAKNGCDRDLFDRQKKAALGRQIRALNAFDAVCYNMAHAYFRNYDAFEATEVLNAITPDDVTNFVRDNLTPNAMALSVILPSGDA